MLGRSKGRGKTLLGRKEKTQLEQRLAALKGTGKRVCHADWLLLARFTHRALRRLVKKHLQPGDREVIKCLLDLKQTGKTAPKPTKTATKATTPAPSEDQSAEASKLKCVALEEFFTTQKLAVCEDQLKTATGMVKEVLKKVIQRKKEEESSKSRGSTAGSSGKGKRKGRGESAEEGRPAGAEKKVKGALAAEMTTRSAPQPRPSSKAQPAKATQSKATKQQPARCTVSMPGGRPMTRSETAAAGVDVDGFRIESPDRVAKREKKKAPPKAKAQLTKKAREEPPTKPDQSVEDAKGGVAGVKSAMPAPAPAPAPSVLDQLAADKRKVKEENEKEIEEFRAQVTPMSDAEVEEAMMTLTNKNMVGCSLPGTSCGCSMARGTNLPLKSSSPPSAVMSLPSPCMDNRRSRVSGSSTAGRRRQPHSSR